MGPDVGFLAAQVSRNGTCRPIHALEASTPRPMGSQFKLYVLGALAKEIAEDRLSWSEVLTVDDSRKSLGNGAGSLQLEAPGTVVSVEDAATRMISISDNTAADMLIELVGRDRVEAQMARWTRDPSANRPFLTTKQMLLLHYVPGLADAFVATPRGERVEFLAASVDPRPMGDIAAGFSLEPRYVDQVEWFASPEDVCRAFTGLQALGRRPALQRPLGEVLSREVGGVGLDPADWPTVWFKGGSEPGVLALGWLATNRAGDTYVVEAMVSNPETDFAPTTLTELRDLGTDAFRLLPAG